MKLDPARLFAAAAHIELEHAGIRMTACGFAPDSNIAKRSAVARSTKIPPQSPL
jgi:hypothetical protein